MSKNKLEIWKERIGDCKASGLPVTEWCERNGLTKHKYYYWHKMITKPITPSKEMPIFAEVSAPIQASFGQGIKITFKEVDISVVDKDAIALAVQFIHALQKQC